MTFGRGFKNGFMSVRFAILSILRSLFSDKNKGCQDHWDIFVTGHSLGGGLASVCAFELGRMRQGGCH